MKCPHNPNTDCTASNTDALCTECKLYVHPINLDKAFVHIIEPKDVAELLLDPGIGIGQKERKPKKNGLYWHDFMVEYKDKVEGMSQVKLLEAFWYYCNRFQKDEYLDECNKIING